MPSDDDFDDWAEPTPFTAADLTATLTVDWTEPAWIGQLLGPDGEPLLDVTEPRPPVGFTR